MGARVAGVVLFGVLLLLACAHVSLVVGLLRRGAWGKGMLALAIVPLAPWWGWRFGMRRRAWAWVVALGTYAITTMALP